MVEALKLFQFKSYVYFRHKKSIYYKIYIQLVIIIVMIYNNAIKCDVIEAIFIMPPKF